jgi:hypothetical protein
MYPAICGWLLGFLRNRHRKATIKAFDGSRTSLARIISNNALGAGLPHEWLSWDIRVDVVGFAIESGETHLAMVECKNSSPNLMDLSQLLGYSAIALPKYSMLLSPLDPADSLRSLLKTYGRMDVLRYGGSQSQISRSVAIVKWVRDQASIDWGSAIRGDGW